ncbi:MULTISPECIES: HEXXH motif-containing putative peptide modification protein [unclassified Streptomyces]|uniref:aKG-HExxH-type peptide beta-hydroxylase n=1 Tax=unclassified Streptomyces TaxID=2593676 RepID=UPI001F045D64|nr:MULTISPECIES: HEXXH motif-containing putative peptide modification protein [unclassified Streptomyces]MCH0565702.1 radical SAM protein [Streptomyces sp. MUM 2J]MCH0570617.1 radical SAM protein [Streptomyces sp. MUM 136J]
MTLRAFRIGAPLLDALARGGGGAGAVLLLADAEYGRRLLLLRAVLDRAREHGGAVAAGASGLFEVLAGARRTAPDATRRVLGHPSVGPRLVMSWRALAQPGPVASLPLSDVAAAAAVATGQHAEVTLTASGPGAVLPGVGAAVLPGAARGSALLLRDGVLETEGGTRLRVAGPGTRSEGGTPVRTPGAEGARWWPPPRVEGTRAVLDDVDPVAAAGAPRVRLNGDEVRAWRSGTTGALRLLRARHPGHAAEVVAGLRALVPLPAAGGDVHRSGSAAEMFGGVALTLPASAAALAETLVHEVQHSKLVAVMHLVDLLDPAPHAQRQRLLYAPWRDDPRPLSGLLHGTYAFLSVARFWFVEAQAARTAPERHRAQVRCARWREAAAEAAATLLAHEDGLTHTGHRFVAVMHAALAELSEVPLPAAAVREARRHAEGHRVRWMARNAADAAPA